MLTHELVCDSFSFPTVQRKCWWDGIEVDIADPGEPSKVIKLWARRVWTLELSLVSCGSYSLASSLLILVLLRSLQV